MGRIKILEILEIEEMTWRIITISTTKRTSSAKSMDRKIVGVGKDKLLSPHTPTMTPKITSMKRQHF